MWPEMWPDFFCKGNSLCRVNLEDDLKVPVEPFSRQVLGKFGGTIWGDNLGHDFEDNLGNNLGDNVERYGRYLGDTHVGGSTRLLPKWSSDVLLNFVSKIVLGVCFRTCFTHHLSQKYIGLKFGKRY